ncbi:MAG: BlaI/MecI/CopY family transcriptional regulator [Clostridia bacterium]|nr:BlaI/MecI/CopY family transcriptional regulator [Clostridia bacterium]MBR4186807.1 BlaI/MecI/CopY family transcriptional regulator [Clostridia bacterium]MCR4904818.1 BlaI/MecI/CopY family transcriptional regulator [Clostridiales bacterium]
MKDDRIETNLGEIEERFANLIWDNEPIPSGKLVKLAEAELSWKKSTTYTVLRILCTKNIFQNVNCVVTSKISREDFNGLRSKRFVEETFDGSLPQFLTAFSKQKKLTEEEIAALERFIDENRG